jgi:hypothetical protein
LQPKHLLALEPADIPGYVAPLSVASPSDVAVADGAQVTKVAVSTDVSDGTEPDPVVRNSGSVSVSTK